MTGILFLQRERTNEMFVYLGPFRSTLGILLRIQAIFGVIFTGLSCNFYRPKIDKYQVLSIGHDSCQN